MGRRRTSQDRIVRSDNGCPSLHIKAKPNLLPISSPFSLHLSPERSLFPTPTPHKIHFLYFPTCFILYHLSGCYPGVMGTSRAVPLLLIFIPPHIPSEHSPVIISTFPAVSFDTQAAFPCMYMSAQLSCHYRSTSYRLRFFLPFLLIFHLSVLATSFLCPHWASL